MTRLVFQMLARGKPLCLKNTFGKATVESQQMSNVVDL